MEIVMDYLNHKVYKLFYYIIVLLGKYERY